MKITFVGSSYGVPEPNRKCSCIMLEVGERIYFVDMGTSAIDAHLESVLQLHSALTARGMQAIRATDDLVLSV